MFCVSRNTVLAAFDQLIADGHLLAKPGSGVYVAERASAPASVDGGDRRPWFCSVTDSPSTSPVPQAPLSSAKPDETLHLPTRASILADLPLSKLYRPGPPRPFRTRSTRLARVSAGDLGTSAGEGSSRRWGSAAERWRSGGLFAASRGPRRISARGARYPLYRGPNRGYRRSANTLCG